MLLKKNNCIRITIIFLVIFHPGTMRSQEMSGITTGDYAGANAAYLNPASLPFSKYYLDINFLSVGIFHENNFIYQSSEDYSFLNFFKKGYVLPGHTSEYAIGERPFYTRENSMNMAHTNLRITGPSAMFVYGRFAFAVNTAFRTMSIVRDIPKDIAHFIYYGLEYSPQYNIQYNHLKDYHFATMAWTEIGFGFSYIVRQRYYEQISVGISPKVILGHAGSYFNSNQTDYNVPNGHDIDITRMDAEMGYSLPIDYETNDIFYGDVVKGYGMSFDLGFVYRKTENIVTDKRFSKPCKKQYDQYKYSIGVSILDLGYTKFTKKARTFKFQDVSHYWKDADSVVKTYTSINEFSSDISSRFCGSSGCADDGPAFKMMMPLSIVLQFDYHFRNDFYVNASVNQPVRLSDNYLFRPSVISISPRYDSRYFGIHVPISIFDYRQPRVGLALRFLNFTVGSEKLLAFFGNNDFSGIDFYFSVKVSFLKGNCRTGKNRFYCDDLPYRMNSRK